MADISDGTVFSQTDAGNASVTNPGWPEGMPPSRVNDVARALQGAVKRAYDRDHGVSTTTVGGTANAITLTYAVAPAAYVQGQKFAFLATAANTGATTVNVNSLGAKNVFKKVSGSGAAACSGAEIQSGDIVEIEYDGTEFQIMSGIAGGDVPGVFGAITAATTTDLNTVSSGWLQINGTTAITSFGTPANGVRKTVYFAGALTLTNNSNILLPGGANIATASGDTATFVQPPGAGCASATRGGRAAASSPRLPRRRYRPGRMACSR